MSEYDVMKVIIYIYIYVAMEIFTDVLCDISEFRVSIRSLGEESLRCFAKISLGHLVSSGDVDAFI